MCLAWQPRDAPACHDALRATALRDGDCVNHVVRREDLVDRHLLLEEVVCEIDLCGNVAAIDLCMSVSG